jgi:thioredoxin 1
MENEILELTETNFKQETAGRDGILLFYKAICPFCKTVEAVIEKFSKAHPDASLFRVEFEEQKVLADRFNVERAPTLFILKGGEVAVKKAGLMNPKELKALYQGA